MKKILIIIALIILGIILFMSLRETPNSTKDEVVITFPDGFQLSPLFADNEFEFKLGLSGQKEPISMLFLFENETLVPFWMKGMFFPIDIIWLDNQTIVGFETDVQVENPPMTIYRPPTPVDSVLEVPAGFVKAHNLGIGDQLDIDLGKE